MKKQTEIESAQGHVSDQQAKGRKVMRLHRETLRNLTEQDLRIAAGGTATYTCGTETTVGGCIMTGKCGTAACGG